MRETWKSVYGWAGVYEVSDLGRVKRIAKGGAAVVGRVLKHGIVGAGYHRVVLCRPGVQRRCMVARLVARAFIGPARGLEVNHIDGDKDNNTVRNLEWVSHQQNMRHCIELGLRDTARGTRNAIAKLTDAKVRKMRALSAAGVSYSALGRQFGVTNCVARRAIVGETWKHVA